MTATDLSTHQGTWTLDPTRTSVDFTTKAMWILPVKGTLRATGGSASLGGDGTVTGSVVFDAASVDTRNKKRDAHLRTADFFDVEHFPTFAFTVTGGSVRDGQLELTGDLTVHGQSHAVTVPGKVAADGHEATFTGTIDIDRSVWGLTWTKLGAGLANHVTVTATFTKD